jgi:DHA1 family bicyclomycin/chloramphenicol resistance-like MFS transporter
MRRRRTSADSVIAPLVMHSTLTMAITSFAMLCIGIGSWIWVKPRLAA